MEGATPTTTPTRSAETELYAELHRQRLIPPRGPTGCIQNEIREAALRRVTHLLAKRFHGDAAAFTAKLREAW